MYCRSPPPHNEPNRSPVSENEKIGMQKPFRNFFLNVRPCLGPSKIFRRNNDFVLIRQNIVSINGDCNPDTIRFGRFRGRKFHRQLVFEDMFVLSETLTPKSNPFGENTRKKIVKKENDRTITAYKIVLSKPEF